MGKRHTVSYTNPNSNPFRTLPKDAPQRDRPRDYSAGRGGGNDRAGGHVPGPIGSVVTGPIGGGPPVGGMGMNNSFRGGRGGFNQPRGNMGGPFMGGRGNFGPVGGPQGSPQPGFQSPMGGNFGNPNMPMQQFGAGGFQGNFQGRGGMGMRGGPNMRGRGMGPNPMMAGGMGGMPGGGMGMGGNMGGMGGPMGGMGGSNMESGGFNPMGNMGGFGMGGMGKNTRPTCYRFLTRLQDPGDSQLLILTPHFSQEDPRAAARANGARITLTPQSVRAPTSSPSFNERYIQPCRHRLLILCSTFSGPYHYS